MAAIPTRFRLKWSGSQDLRTTFADQLSVVKSGSTVYLTFGEVTPPIMIDSDVEETDVAIRTVARIAIPMGAFDAIANVITRMSEPETNEVEGTDDAVDSD